MKEGDDPSLSAPLLDAGRRKGMRIVPGFRPIARTETPTPPLSKEQEESISADLMKAAEELAESASKLGDELGDSVEKHTYGNDNQNEDTMTQRTYADDVAGQPTPPAARPSNTQPSLTMMAMAMGGELLKAGAIALIAGIGTAAGGAAWHKMTGKARQQAARKNAAYAAGGALAGAIGGWLGAKNI